MTSPQASKHVARRNDPARQLARIKRRLRKVVLNHAVLNDSGEPLCCITRGGSGQVIRKIVYADRASAIAATEVMRSIEGSTPQFVYLCEPKRGMRHYHHTSQVKEALPPSLLPKQATKDSDSRRRYRRKCGVASALLEYRGSLISMEELATKLDWPLGRTMHGNPGRTVLRDLLCSFSESGFVRFGPGDNEVLVTDPYGLRILAESVSLLGPPTSASEITTRRD